LSAAARVPHAAPTGETWTVLRTMLWSADYLRAKGVDNARIDAEHLLAHALGVGRLEMYLQHERPLTRRELDDFRPLLRRRASREPLQYVLGRQAFRTLDLEVGPGVLIPRPETEQLVEAVLARARGRRAEGAGPVGLDLGTGSGAIALALACEGPFERFVATDVSPAALKVAARNRDALGMAGRIELRAGRYFEPVGPEERFDVVVSNPPYVAETSRGSLAREIVDWEPAEALFAGVDGLDALRTIVAGAGRVLRPAGLLALEVGVGQARVVAALVEARGEFHDIEISKDLAGKERIVTATLSTGTNHRGE
jgi:release factor glutamine methyltransferase